MLNNYVACGLRSILKRKVFFLINLMGLAAGMTVCMLLFLWIQDELSYDGFHVNSERIFRVTSQYESDGQAKRSATTPAPLGPALMAEFPEVEKTVRLAVNGFQIQYLDKIFSEQVFFGDPELFEIFTFPLVQGNPQSALKNPYSVIISQHLKTKLFGTEDAIGKVLQFNAKRDVTITGVFKDIPANSHFRCEIMGCFTDFAKNDVNQWGISNYYTYIMVSQKFSMPAFRAKLPAFIRKYQGPESVDIYKSDFPIQPLTSIHLHSDLRNEIEPNSNMRIVLIFAAVALLILLIACLNYINLAIASYIKRIKEFGLRKIFGANGQQFLSQFLLESMLFSFLAFPLAILLVWLLLPFFNSVTEKSLSLFLLTEPVLMVGMLGMLVLVIILSGILPALFVNYIKPVNALKGIFNPHSTVSLLRRGLVVFQFTISIIFLLNTFTIYNQIKYIRTKDLGFTKEHIIYIPLQSSTALEKYETIKTGFLQRAAVRSVSATTFYPGKDWSTNYWREGIADNGNNNMGCCIVDEDFINTFQLKLIQGRNFSPPVTREMGEEYILNESAVKEFGWQSPIGQPFMLGLGKKGTVVGVVKDFFFQSLHFKITPMALYVDPQRYSYLAVRLTPENEADTIAFLKQTWERLVPDQVFEFTFFDENLNRLYQGEETLGKLFMGVTILTVLIAILGLLGVVAFTVEQRAKEVGIRKVLGASPASIFLIFSNQFTRWVIIANIIALPIGWMIINRWLQHFANRIGFSMGTLLLSVGLSLALTVLTLSYNVLKITRINPALAIRGE